jgi:hypothetical protein
VTGSNSQTINFNKGTKSSNPLTRITLDNLNITALQKNSFSHTPLYIDSTNQKVISGKYSYRPTIKPFRPLNLFNFSYFPTSFGTNTGYNRNWSKHFSKEQDEWKLSTSGLNRYLTFSRNISYGPLQILSGSYSDNQQRDLDLNYQNDTLSKRLGEVINLSKTFSTSLTPSLWDWSRPSLTFNSTYTEDRRPENRTLVADSFPVRNVGNNNTASLTFDVGLPRLLKLLTRIRNEEQDSTAATGSPQWAAIKVEQFSRYLKRPTILISRGRSTSFKLLKKRPDWEYQFGLREMIPKELKHEDPLQTTYYDQKTVTDNFSTQSGLSTTLLNINASYATNKTTSTTSSNPHISHSTIWPNVSFQFPQLIKFIPKNEILKIASASITYREDKNSSEIVGKGTQNESESESWAPSLQTTWVRDIRVSLSANFSENTSHTFEPVSLTTNSKTTGYKFMIAYSFNAPTGLMIPLIGNRISFSSNLDAGLDFNYSKNYAVRLGESDPTNNMINYMVSPRVSYNFSNNITGGLIGNYSMINDKKQNRKSTTTGLDLWVEFRF